MAKCHPRCVGWDDDDHGLGCFGWCAIKNIPITSNEVYYEECTQRKDRTNYEKCSVQKGCKN